MDASKIAEVITHEPFQPFEITVANGERIKIRKPLRALVTGNQLLLGVEEDARTGLSTRLRRLAVAEITGVKPMRVNGARKGRR